MNIDKLRQIIKEKDLYKKENTKNIICKCISCGDHSDKSKSGHCYVSKDPNKPVVHCFLCGWSTPLTRFIYDLTADKTISNEIISKEELESARLKHTKKVISQKKKIFQIPEIDTNKFPNKASYIRKRSNFKMHSTDFNNLIFDFNAFAEMNNLNHIRKQEGDVWDYMQKSFVAYITRNQSILACRNIDSTSKFKFRKMTIQETELGLLDYVKFEGNDPESNILVLCEGVYDAIGEMAHDTLKIKNSVRMYAAGLSWSYSSLLKSICFDETMFKSDVYILSDKGVSLNVYYKFRNDNYHVLNNTRVFYNKNPGGDFGSFPIVPCEVKLDSRSQQRSRKYSKYKRYS